MSLLNFCNDCETYMVLKIRNENQKQVIQYHCNNCGFVKKNIDQKCIVKNDYNLQQLYILDKNIKYVSEDPSNPRIDNLPCPNKDCVSHKLKKNDVVYISINNYDMKYLYICNHCKKKWTNN